MGYCPTRAIEANYLLGVGAYVLAALIPTAALLSWLEARLSVFAFLRAVPSLVLETVYAIVILALACPIFHVLLGVRWVNRLLSLLTPTHYYRRYHEPDTALEELD